MGFAAGFAAGTQAKQGRQQLRLEKDKLLLESNAKVMQELTAQAAAIAKAGREAGRSQEEIERAIAPIRKALERSSLDDVRIRRGLLGQPMNPQSAMSTFEGNMSIFDAAVLSGIATPTPEEAAVAKAQAGVAGTKATAGALTAAGAPTTVGEAAVAAGQRPAAAEPEIINIRMPDGTTKSIDANSQTEVQAALNAGGVRSSLAPAEPRASNIQNFRTPDGKVVGVDANDPAAIADIVKRGGVKVTLGVQATTLDELGGVSAVSKKELEATKETIQSLNADIEELDDTLTAFEENPAAGGISGAVIENVGGLIQQIPLIGEKAVQAAGIDPAAVKVTRNKARATASRLLTAITKEEGRFTDSERQIATEVLSALTPTASGEQIVAALQSAADMVKRSESRELVRFLQASGADLSNPKGEIDFVQALIDNGFKEERAIDAMLDLKERLGL